MKYVIEQIGEKREVTRFLTALFTNDLLGEFFCCVHTEILRARAW